MEGGRDKRRLTAILAADIVGYSRLMGADESGTLAQLKTHRKELIDPKVSEYGGRIVKTTGDGILIEFPSVLDAVQCAVDVQRAIAQRNTHVPEDKRVQFRMGINQGDVIVEEDDLYGDGINVAARLEGVAEPGGICISQKVHDEVRDKVGLHFNDLGEHALKNIARPVQTYSIDLTSASGEPFSAETLPLPDKPSIAVLPFDNMSGDPDQEYFADGMVEEITAALSRVHSFFVVARNSSFVFKGKATDAKQVARLLGVRYVLEGSVRKSGDRVRITAQSIDGVNDRHVWADKYDGTLGDIFDLQDQVAESVVGQIEPELRSSEIERSRRKPTKDLNAYDCFLRALPHANAMTREDNEEALRLTSEAVARDPD